MGCAQLPVLIELVPVRPRDHPFPRKPEGRELMGEEPYMGKHQSHAVLVIVTHGIPRNPKTIGKGGIIINEDTEAQRDNMPPM